MEETEQTLELGGKDSREVREADVAEDHRSLGASCSVEVSERTDLGVSSKSVSPLHIRQHSVPPSLLNVISVFGTQVSFSDGDLGATGTTFIMPSDQLIHPPPETVAQNLDLEVSGLRKIPTEYPSIYKSSLLPLR